MVITCRAGSPSSLFRSWLVRALEKFWTIVEKSGVFGRMRSITGQVVHWLIRRYQERYVSEYTRFFRNPPQLDALLALVKELKRGENLNLTVLGCSTGAELYSALWTIRSARPDLNVKSIGLDISASAIRTAQGGVYARDSDEMRDIDDEKLEVMFDCGTGHHKVKQCVTEGVSFLVGDACDPNLPETLGPQDIIIANNFLIHLPNQLAEACLNNIFRLVAPGGHIFVWGVDLDIKCRVLKSLGMEPVTYNLEDIYHADVRAREVWPLKWWGLEPLDNNRCDWMVRYCTVFRKPLDV